LPEYVNIFMDNGYDEMEVNIAMMTNDKLIEVGINKMGQD